MAQKVVYTDRRSSSLMDGDPDIEAVFEGKNYGVLPRLLTEGWVIKIVATSGDTGTLVVLEKPPSAESASLP